MTTVSIIVGDRPNVTPCSAESTKGGGGFWLCW